MYKAFKLQICVYVVSYLILVSVSMRNQPLVNFFYFENHNIIRKITFVFMRSALNAIKEKRVHIANLNSENTTIG